MEYVAALKQNSIAKTVKLADLRHNSDRTRLDYIDAHAEQRCAKYEAAIQLLEE